MVRKSRRVTQVINSRGLNVNPDYSGADTFNKEGARAWTKPIAESFKQFLYTNTFENTFYVSQRGLIKQGEEICKQAFKELDSYDYCADQIVAARNDGYMREAPIFALVHLSMHDIKQFRKIFNDVVRTGADLIKFLDYCRSLRGLGRGIKKAVHAWLQKNTSEFYALKYRKAIYDAINLTRPNQNIFTSKQAVIHDWVKESEGIDEVDFSTVCPQIAAYEALKMVDTITVEDFKAIQEEARLNQELITSTVEMTPEIWKAAAPSMGVFALLRHLATFEKNGIIDDLAELITSRITPQNLINGKVFPFRVILAYEMVTNSLLKRHLESVLNEYVPMYDFSHYGRTAICPDVSGSMGFGSMGTMRRGRGNIKSYDQVSGYLAGILHKGVPNSIVIPWGKRTFIGPTSDKSVIEIAKAVKAKNTGTFMEAAINKLIETETIRDTVILITDTMEWGLGWLTAWKKYKKNVAPEAKAFLIRIDAYRTNPFAAEEAAELDIHQVYGWSDTVFKYIEFVLKE